MTIWKLKYLFLALAFFGGHLGYSQLEFIENLGQWHDNVEFRADLPGGAIFLEDNEFTYSFYDADLFHELHLAQNEVEAPEYIRTHAFQVEFLNANSNFTEGRKKNSQYYNYFTTPNSDQWKSNVPSFNQVFYYDLYTGIDLLMYQKNGSLKYDFKVRPNQDPKQISLKFKGLDRVFLKDANLHLKTSINEIVELAPYAYQFIEGKIFEVDCTFHLEGDLLTFDLGEYNADYALTIDPEITFSTYVGAASDNWGSTATYDSEGNLIGGASVRGPSYPVTMGAEQATFEGGQTDCGISKFSSDGGELLYSTFLGGSQTDVAHSLYCDSNDNIIIFGTTGSMDYPVTAGAYQTSHAGGPSVDYDAILATHDDGCDMFISKLSPDGTGLMASTFLGGSSSDGLNVGNKLWYNYGDLFRGEVITNELDKIIISSVTSSSNFPIVNGADGSYGGGTTDGVVFQFNSNLGTLEWSSFVGGNNADAAYSVQVSESEQLVVAGGTKSSNLAVSEDADEQGFLGDVDGFIMVFSEDGSEIEACTYLGSPGYDQNYFVQLDIQDNVYVYGQTDSNMPIIGDVYSNPNSGQFIRKYPFDLSSILWSTTIGTGSGEIDISPTAFLVSDCDQIYISGWGGVTNSNNSDYAFLSTTDDMPITGDAFQTTTDGSDFYLAVLSADASVLSYATYFGGPSSREHVDGGTSKFDKNGSVYQAVCAGCGGLNDFPSTPGAWSPDNPSSNCNLGVFKFDLAIINASIEIDGPTEVCEGQPISFSNNSIGGTDYLWDFGTEDNSDEFEPTYTYEENGTFTVAMMVSHTEDCIQPDTAYVEITVLPGVSPTAGEPDLVCSGGEVQLEGFGTENIFWLDNVTLSDPSIWNPIATPEVETTYYLVDFNECEADTIPVEVLFYDIETNISESQEICIGSSVNLSVEGGVNYLWSPAGSLNNPNIPNPIATPDETTTYNVIVTTIEGCEVETQVTITVVVDFPGGNVYPDVGTCIGEPIMLDAIDANSWIWSPAETLLGEFTQNPIANPPVTTTYFVEVSNLCGTGTDQVTVNVITPEAFAGDPGTICQNQLLPVWASGGEQYFWSPSQYATEPFEAETFVSPPESMDMTVSVTDEFGCTATATVFVNVLPLPYVNAGPDLLLDWGEEAIIYGSSEGVESFWTPDFNINCTDCPSAEIFAQEPIYYVYHTIDALGCENRDSVFVDVFNPIFVPNSFSPNGDGNNDLFYVEGLNIREFELVIWNRWGEVIFKTNDPLEPWDGSFNRGEYYVQNGTYLWSVSYKIKAGQEKLTGHVTLFR